MLSSVEAPASPVRVAVVGAGHVGATFAYALLLSGLASEVVLVDADRDRAEGEAMDLGHAVPFSRPARVRAGDISATAGGVPLASFAAARGGVEAVLRLELDDGEAAALRRSADVLATTRRGIDGGA